MLSTKLIPTIKYGDFSSGILIKIRLVFLIRMKKIKDSKILATYFCLLLNLFIVNYNHEQINNN